MASRRIRLLSPLNSIDFSTKPSLLTCSPIGNKIQKSNYIPKFFTKDSNFLLAIDESTTIKNPKAKRTKALVSFGLLAKYKRILTGSPVTNSPMDLYSQCGFMSKDLLGHDSFWSFQGKYAISRTQRMGAHSFQQIVGYKNLDDLSERFSSVSPVKRLDAYGNMESNDSVVPI